MKASGSAGMSDSGRACSWPEEYIDALLEGTRKKLREAGVKDENVVVQSVPGSYELPYAVKQYVNYAPR